MNHGEYSDEYCSDDTSSVVPSELVNCELTTSFEWKSDSDVSYIYISIY